MGAVGTHHHEGAGRDQVAPEDDPFAVRRHVRLELIARIVGEASRAGAVRPHAEDVHGAAAVAGEHDPRAVRRPLRVPIVGVVRGDLTDARAIEPHRADLVVAAANADVGDAVGPLIGPPVRPVVVRELHGLAATRAHPVDLVVGIGIPARVEDDGSPARGVGRVLDPGVLERRPQLEDPWMRTVARHRREPVGGGDEPSGSSGNCAAAGWATMNVRTSIAMLRGLRHGSSCAGSFGDVRTTLQRAGAAR